MPYTARRGACPCNEEEMATTTEIAESIRDVGLRLNAQISGFGWATNTPLSQNAGFHAIGVSTDSIVGFAEIVARRVERLTKQQLDSEGFGTWLDIVSAELDYLKFTHMNQSPAVQAANALAALQMIQAAIPALPPKEPKINWDDIKDQKNLIPKDLTTRLRSIDSRLKDLEPRSKEIGAKIADIESAHAAADQLPTDLAELAERRAELAALIEQSQVLARQISEDAVAATDARGNLAATIEHAEHKITQTISAANNLLERSEKALRGATAVGLSKAFHARKKTLSLAGFLWTVGLALALFAAAWIGKERVETLKEVLTGDKSAVVIIVNALLALIGIGAPAWFAWLATKQIGSTFRLAEDYAFKSSVAQAYEGYRTEALDIDDEMRTRLFASALERFEEAPIRLVDPQSHNSPMQEALSNSELRRALDALPDLGGKLSGLLKAKEVGVETVLPEMVSSKLEEGRPLDDL